jgi:hypothetical protein
MKGKGGIKMLVLGILGALLFLLTDTAMVFGALAIMAIPIAVAVYIIMAGLNYGK